MALSRDSLSYINTYIHTYARWNDCDSFTRLLIMRCIRPDKLVPAVMLYVSKEMGQKFIEPPPFDLAVRTCFVCVCLCVSVYACMHVCVYMLYVSKEMGQKSIEPRISAWL